MLSLRSILSLLAISVLAVIVKRKLYPKFNSVIGRLDDDITYNVVIGKFLTDSIGSFYSTL